MNKFLRCLSILLSLFAFSAALSLRAAEPVLTLSPQGYLETPGLNVLAYSNFYDGAFSDSKISSVELIHHGVRTATNGDVRLSATPGQWDAVPTMVSRTVDAVARRIDTVLEYKQYAFKFTVRVEAEGAGARISVLLDQPVPEKLAGHAGLNMEFLPAAYFHRSYLADGLGGVFPLHPASTMERATGSVELLALAKGHTLVLAPEDPLHRVMLEAKGAELALYDGRNLAQNAWFVVRTVLPAGKTGAVVQWLLTANTLPGWTRSPVIAHSQLGYHPAQPKVAAIELDANDTPAAEARLYRVTEKGELVEALVGPTQPWGRYLRYQYVTFDFSEVRTPGLYVIGYKQVRTAPFRIAPDVYADAWHHTLDLYLPIAMDHMYVKEAYRVWHGDPHRDDALQAPINHTHFDLYGQGPTTDTPYQPGEHIPGLNVGGWHDAGDFDIRTQTQYAVVSTLVHAWEDFHLDRDQTQVDEALREAFLHRPDGVPDILQQIEHGAIQLIAQFHAVGHAIPGIIDSDLSRYTHLGDAASQTDNYIYNPKLKPGQIEGNFSGRNDDRWAFTSRSTPLNYGSIAALAAASRALRGYRDDLANECLATAKRVWADEHSHPPFLYQIGNTGGGHLADEELKAAVELLLTTKDVAYGRRVMELWPAIDERFAFNAAIAARAIPYVDAAFAEKMKARTRTYVEDTKKLTGENPFGVPVTRTGWAGSGIVMHFANAQYLLHRAFPDLVGTDGVFNGLHYLLGHHPGSDISLVSAVGTISKEVAYGNNRADFAFIPGGVVPGMLILKPDFPENKEDWPFLWGENEYVVDGGAEFIYLAAAVQSLLAPPR